MIQLPAKLLKCRLVPMLFGSYMEIQVSLLLAARRSTMTYSLGWVRKQLVKLSFRVCAVLCL